jgi:hypothetical protein
VFIKEDQSLRSEGAIHMPHPSTGVFMTAIIANGATSKETHKKWTPQPHSRL